ncbi:MAG: carbohydrate-binding family 9-like protein [Clostridia bacterium]|nr:carbohydrate-binding family 9-like protein [Clostridia bacterium]
MQNRKSFTIKKEYGEAQNLGLVLQGEKPKLGTKFSMFYDEQGIHVRVECEIGKTTHSAFEGEFVPVWQADAVEVFFSPEGKEDWYYEFDFAPNGSYFHGHIYNPDGWTAYNHAFDPDHGVKGDVKIKDGVWTTEMFIPFAEMGLKGKTLGEIKALPWRFNLYRIEDAGREYSSFAPTKAKKINFHVSACFADLIFE